MAGAEMEVQNATSDEGYHNAIVEFEAAAKAAPEWSTPYYNLGMMYMKLKDHELALKNYRKYLRLAPNAADAPAVKNEIYKIEYVLSKRNKVKGIDGTWLQTDMKRWWLSGVELYISYDGGEGYLYVYDSRHVPVRSMRYKQISTKGKTITLQFERGTDNLVLHLNEDGELEGQIEGKPFVLSKRVLGLTLNRKLRVGPWARNADGTPIYGFYESDQVTEINSEKVKFKNTRELYRLLNSFPKGASVTFTVKRKHERGPVINIQKIP